MPLLDRATLFLEEDELSRLLDRLEAADLRPEAERIRRELITPQSLVTKDLIRLDPMGVVMSILDRVQIGGLGARFDSDSGLIVDPARTTLLMLVKPTQPAQDIVFDRQLAAGLELRVAEAEASWREDGWEGAPPAVEFTGGYIIALDDSQLIVSDARGRRSELPGRRDAALPARLPSTGDATVRVSAAGDRSGAHLHLRRGRARTAELGDLGVRRAPDRARNRLHHRALRPLRRGAPRGLRPRVGARRDRPPHRGRRPARRGDHRRHLLRLPGDRFPWSVRARSADRHRNPPAGADGLPGAAGASDPVQGARPGRQPAVPPLLRIGPAVPREPRAPTHRGGGDRARHRGRSVGSDPARVRRRHPQHAVGGQSRCPAAERGDGDVRAAILSHDGPGRRRERGGGARDRAQDLAQAGGPGRR